MPVCVFVSWRRHHNIKFARSQTNQEIFLFFASEHIRYKKKNGLKRALICITITLHNNIQIFIPSPIYRNIY